MAVNGLPNLEIYKSLNFTIDNLIADNDGAGYSACSFTIDNSRILYRKAKITPTKNGQFVTLWKRINNNPIAPFSVEDNIATVVISVERTGFSGSLYFHLQYSVNGRFFRQMVLRVSVLSGFIRLGTFLKASRLPILKNGNWITSSKLNRILFLILKKP